MFISSATFLCRSLFTGDLKLESLSQAPRSLVNKLLQYCIVALLAAGPLTAADHPLTGTWQLDPARSTEFSPWRDYVLTVGVDGDRLTLHRQLGWGRRQFADQMTVSPGSTVTVSVAMWPDNRHLGAYIGGDRTKRVRADWLDDGRILRLSTDLVLDTSQGPRSINILSDYKVSASGTVLVLTELRSTRNRPVVYVFTRAK